MMRIPPNRALYAAVDSIDFWRSFDALAAIARAQLGLDALRSAVVLFFRRDRTRCKLLFRDGSGIVVRYKRLDRGHYAPPAAVLEGDRSVPRGCQPVRCWRILIGGVVTASSARGEAPARCEWVARARDIVLLGPVGTGKTDLAIALAMAAVGSGYGAMFFRASELVRALSEARDKRQLGRLHERLQRCDVQVRDDAASCLSSARAASCRFTCCPRATSAALRCSPPTSPSASGTECSASTSSRRCCSIALLSSPT